MGKLHFPITVGIGAWPQKNKENHTRDGVEKKEKKEKWASRPRVNDRVTDPHLTAMS